MPSTVPDLPCGNPEEITTSKDNLSLGKWSYGLPYRDECLMLNPWLPSSSFFSEKNCYVLSFSSVLFWGRGVPNSFQCSPQLQRSGSKTILFFLHITPKLLPLCLLLFCFFSTFSYSLQMGLSLHLKRNEPTSPSPFPIILSMVVLPSIPIPDLILTYLIILIAFIKIV